MLCHVTVGVRFQTCCVLLLWPCQLSLVSTCELQVLTSLHRFGRQGKRKVSLAGELLDPHVFVFALMLCMPIAAQCVLLLVDMMMAVGKTNAGALILHLHPFSLSPHKQLELVSARVVLHRRSSSSHDGPVITCNYGHA